MASRWGEEQVLALATDPSAVAAGQKVSRGDAAWDDVAARGHALWGSCAGSGSSAYRVVVDLTGPAFRCSCPSRKFPCKHALGLLLRWARGAVPEVDETPDDVATWLASRQQRTEKASRPAAAAQSATGPAGDGRADKREQRVAAGLDELERWLHDQLRAGLATARHDGPAESARVAARLVDAQVAGAAGVVRELPWHSGEDRWPDRVLADMARLALLVSAHRGLAAGAATAEDSGAGAAPETADVAAEVVRSRIGWSTPADDVLARPGTSDRWLVLWQVDEPDGRLVTRRAHVHGSTTGVDAFVLAWGAGGQPPDTGLVPGTVLDADLHTYPGRPSRALVGQRRSPAGPPDGDRATGLSVAAAQRRLADGLARDPWVREVPVVLAGVRPARDRGSWMAMDLAGHWLPLVGAGTPLDWLATTAGHPADVAGELSRDGFRLRAVLGVHEAQP